MNDLQNYYLQQMGIVPWRLRVNNLSSDYLIASHAKLILIASCHSLSSAQKNLFYAIAEVLDSNVQQVDQSTLSGIAIHKRAICFDEAITHPISCEKIYTLQQMLENPLLKQQLWQQLKLSLHE